MKEEVEGRRRSLDLRWICVGGSMALALARACDLIVTQTAHVFFSYGWIRIHLHVKELDGCTRPLRR